MTEVVGGVADLRPEHGPVFAVVGVFDGLHRGHAYLLDHLVREADAHAARPTVITFDHHPDEVLTGTAPPLLIDPEERLERLSAAGVEIVVVQHFDEAVRQTPYDRFVDVIRLRAALAGLLMTPDAAFGYERRGTPGALTELGERLGFDVVVVPPFTMDGQPVRSSRIREAIALGDLATAGRLLGRDVTLVGDLANGNGGAISFAWPMAMPPDGEYACSLDDSPATLVVSGGHAALRGYPDRTGRIVLTLNA